MTLKQALSVALEELLDETPVAVIDPFDTEVEDSLIHPAEVAFSENAEIEKIEELAESMESLAATIEHLITNEMASPATALMVRHSMEAIFNPHGVDVPVASLESFEDVVGYHTAAVESLRETATKLKDQAAGIAKSTVDDLIYSFKREAGKLEQAGQRLEKARASYNGKKDELQKEGAVLNYSGLKFFLTNERGLVTDIAAGVKHDLEITEFYSSELPKEYAAIFGQIESELAGGFKTDAEAEAFVKKVAGLKNPLRSIPGNHVGGYPLLGNVGFHVADKKGGEGVFGAFGQTSKITIERNPKAPRELGKKDLAIVMVFGAALGAGAVAVLGGMASAATAGAVTASKVGMAKAAAGTAANYGAQTAVAGAIGKKLHGSMTNVEVDKGDIDKVISESEAFVNSTKNARAAITAAAEKVSKIKELAGKIEFGEEVSAANKKNVKAVVDVVNQHWRVAEGAANEAIKHALYVIGNVTYITEALVRKAK